MDNFLDNLSVKTKNIAYNALVAVIFVICIRFLCEFIDALARGSVQFFDCLCLILSVAIQIGVVLFGVLAYKHGNKVAFKTFFVLYFGYIFLSRLLNLFGNFGYFEYGSAFSVVYGVFMTIAFLLVALIGIFTVVDAINSSEKYVKTVRCLMLVYFGILIAMFMLYFIGTCTKNCLWINMLEPVFDFTVALAFFGFYNKKYCKEDKTKANELKFNDETEE